MSEGVLDELGLSVGDKIDLNELNFISRAIAYGETSAAEAPIKYINRSVECTVVGKIVGSGQSLVYIPIGARSYYKSLMPSVNLELVEYAKSPPWRLIGCFDLWGWTELTRNNTCLTR